jgi:hypothetical protein
MNWLSWGRSNCVVDMQGSWSNRVDPTKREQLKPPCDPDADLAGIQASFERLAEMREFISFVGHPVCWGVADWGDLYEYAVLFRHGGPLAYPRPAYARPAQPRSPEDRAAALELTRKTLRWIKSRSDVNLTSYARLCERDEEDRVQWVTLPQAASLGRRMRERLTYLTDYGTSFSPADVTGLLTFACDYCWRYGRWPERVPVQRLLGPTEPPLASATPVTLTRENLLAGALAAYTIMMEERRMPGTLRASFVDVGPGTWLHALSEFVGRSLDTGELPLEVTVTGAPTLLEAVEEPVIQERRFGSSNHRPGLTYDHLWELLRWQAWSFRPAVSR